MNTKRDFSSFISRNTLIAAIGGGVTLIVAAVVVFFFHRGQQPTPPPQITPPASLSELVEQYPQLANLLTNPELDSVYKEFLVVYQEGGMEAARKLAYERGLLTPQGDVAVTLVLDTEDSAALVKQLQAAGVTVVSVYRDRINVSVPMALIEAQLASEDPGAVFEQLTGLEHVIGVELPTRRTRDASTVPGEGVARVAADVWQRAGFTGQGVRIGVLDLGFAGYEKLLGVELPESVVMQTFGWYDGEEVHGTACAEIIHEVAPGAELFLAWYDGSDAAMGEAVDWLLAQGVNIISHSASSIVGPRDGSSWDARLVNEVAARGVLWVNSSGNQGLSHYRGLFTDTDGDGIHEFAPGEETLAIYNYGSVAVALNWDDDWQQAAQDYELYLYDSSGNQLASSEEPQEGEIGQEPVEWIFYRTEGETVYAVVLAYKVERPVILDIFVNGGEVAQPSQAYSLCPPADAVGSLTVGAANWQDDSLADYSSQGPTTDGRLKPEISAPTGVSGATYGRTGFDGTSSSCPHVAAAAALVWQAYPDFSRQEVVDFLLANAMDLGVAGPDTGYGYGRLQFPAAPGSAALPRPTSTPFAPLEPGATPIPLPTPTVMVYATPPPQPPTSQGAGSALLALTGLGLLAGGLCCVGGGLLLVGLFGAVVMRRRNRRARQAPPPPAHPPAASPPSVAAPRAPHCARCGAPLREGARFCPRCGQPIAG